jgi:hypothetical protein
MPGYRITFDEAVKLVSNFVKELNPKQNKIPLGGTIEKDSLYGKTKTLKFSRTLFKGNMAWMCWNEPSIGNYPKFFLAFEENDSYLDGAEVPFPDMTELMMPSNIFGYNNEIITDLISDHFIDIHTTSYRDALIDRDSEVLDLVQNFKDNGPKDQNKQPYNKYPYGFFKNSTNDIVDFLRQPDIAFVRYYFGFDDTTQYHKETNRIRIILIGVDKDGKNITPTGARATRTDVVMLQKSWPPPPDN